MCWIRAEKVEISILHQGELDRSRNDDIEQHRVTSVAELISVQVIVSRFGSASFGYAAMAIDCRVSVTTSEIRHSSHSCASLPSSCMMRLSATFYSTSPLRRGDRTRYRPSQQMHDAGRDADATRCQAARSQESRFGLYPQYVAPVRNVFPSLSMARGIRFPSECFNLLLT